MYGRWTRRKVLKKHSCSRSMSRWFLLSCGTTWHEVSMVPRPRRNHEMDRGLNLGSLPNRSSDIEQLPWLCDNLWFCAIMYAEVRTFLVLLFWSLHVPPLNHAPSQHSPWFIKELNIPCTTLTIFRVTATTWSTRACWMSIRCGKVGHRTDCYVPFRGRRGNLLQWGPVFYLIRVNVGDTLRHTGCQ